MKINNTLRLTSKTRKLSFVCSVSLFALILAISLIIPTFVAKSSNAEENNSITNTPLSINLTIPSSIDLNVEPNSTGSFSSATVQARISTNNYTGYQLSAETTASRTGANTDLINSADNSSTISSLSQGTQITTEQFSSASATSYNNKYGISTDSSSTQNKTYKAIPVIGSTALEIDETDASGEHTKDITIGSRVDTSISSGNYSSEGNYALVFSATANSFNYAIHYDADTTDTVTNMPSPNPEGGLISGSSYTISNNTPVRPGYEFGGWCSEAVTNNSTASPSCPGTTYQPGTTYEDFFDVSVQNTNVNIYAIWTSTAHTITLDKQGGTGGTSVIYETPGEKFSLTAGGPAMTPSANPIVKPTKTETYTISYNMNSTGVATPTDPAYLSAAREDVFEGYYGPATPATPTTMQEMTPEYCDSMAESDSMQLKDSRDNKYYWITKLKDGNCWMTQNLDYDLSVTANKSLKAATSDVSSDKNLTIYTSWGTNASRLYYKNSGDQYLPDGSGTATNITCTSANNDENCHYHIGDYYSWNAATASTSSSNTNYSNASGSICPKGWRLPTSYDGSSSKVGDFTRLNNAYGGSTSSDSTLLASPLYFARPSYVTGSGGAVSSLGTDGDYWSATVRSSSAAYFLSFGGSSINLTNNSNRYRGQSVRCIARSSEGPNLVQYINSNGYLTNDADNTYFTEDGTLTAQWSEGSNPSFTLPPLAKDGYDCKWAAGSASGTQYAPGATVSIPANTIFYAVCKLPTPTTMQGMYTTYCSEMAEGASLQLKDERDNKLYWVTKLKDGNCWMTQNLDYDLSVTANKSLKAATSDVSSDTTLTITSSWGTSNTALYYKAGAEQYLPNGSGTAANITCTSANNGGNNCHYHLGDYYSWNAATASTSSSNTNYSNASGSICPKGWRLPTSYDGSSSKVGDFTRLNNAYGGSTSSDSTLLASPLYFVRSGYVDGGSLINVGSYGFYLSSTVYGSSNVYSLYLYTSVVVPTYYINLGRYVGRSVRCVARDDMYAYTINYNANGGTGGPASPEVHVAQGTGTTVALSSDTPTSTDPAKPYFQGWSTNPSATTADYKAGGNYTFAQGTNSVTLYAVYGSTIPTPTTMQNFTFDYCSSMTTDSSISLTDTRNNKSYNVAKLADGHCWMQENLSLGSNSTITLTPQNSDVSSNFTLPASSTSWSTSNVDSAALYVDNNNFGTSRTEVFYNWYTATAGTGTSSLGEGNAPSSICPKGWRLPIVSADAIADGEFYKMFNPYIKSGKWQIYGEVAWDNVNSSDYTNAPLSLSFAGVFDPTDQAVTDKGMGGLWWSSATISSESAAIAYAGRNGFIRPVYDEDRLDGGSVRCVARDTRTLSDIQTMQEMNSEICSNSAENESKALIDTRGPEPYESYTVKKLADGKCWMAENLRLGGSSSITLHDTDTNMTASTWTLPASSTNKFSNNSAGYTTAGINTSKKSTVQSASGHSPAGKIGVFYNYCAASAGTYCMASSSGSGDAAEDICPKGWRMPTIGEYSALYNKYGSSSTFQSALVTPLSGYFNNDSVVFQGSFGYFWSSTWHYGDSIRRLYVDSSNVSADQQNSTSRYNGNPVRCVAR